ncbi:unnamed protein product [Mytilus edulis]|uniref:VIT domain-containing protein n=1 Tax=Mytilus edulis TaxID=6550 RepID=A0A8S3SC35_MYTED|nr:unnamed protein product [Mytilus edulis]
MASRIKTDTGKKYGLVSGQKPVLLTESKTHVTIQGFIANVESKLTYVNNSTESIETRYVFPIDDMSAVYKFEADINGRHIVAECQEKQQAKITFEEATSTGQAAFFLSESKYAGDIFVCRLGNLDAGETAVLTMAYVVELTVQPDGDLIFELPYVLNTRYSSAGDAGDTRNSIKPVKLGFTASVKGHHKIKSVSTYRDDLQLQISDDKHSAEFYKWCKEIDNGILPTGLITSLASDNKIPDANQRLETTPALGQLPGSSVLKQPMKTFVSNFKGSSALGLHSNNLATSFNYVYNTRRSSKQKASNFEIQKVISSSHSHSGLHTMNVDKEEHSRYCQAGLDLSHQGTPFLHRKICAEVDSGTISEIMFEKLQAIVEDDEQTDTFDTCLKTDIKTEPMDY